MVTGLPRPKCIQESVGAHPEYVEGNMGSIAPGDNTISSPRHCPPSIHVAGFLDAWLHQKLLGARRLVVADEHHGVSNRESEMKRALIGVLGQKTMLNT